MAEIIKLKQQETGTALNKLKWFFLFALFVLALFANTHFANLNNALRLVAWLLLSVLLFAVFVWTTQGKAFLNFAKAARNELLKVVWPTRQETIQSSVAVVVLVAILALLLWLMDSLWFWLITLITG